MLLEKLQINFTQPYIGMFQCIINKTNTTPLPSPLMVRDEAEEFDVTICDHDISIVLDCDVIWLAPITKPSVGRALRCRDDLMTYWHSK